MNPLILVALAALGFVALTSKKAPAASTGGAPVGGMRFRVEMAWSSATAPKPGDTVVANLYGNAGTPVAAGGTETFLGPVKVVLQKRIQAGDASKAELWDAQVAEDHSGSVAEWPAKGRVLTLRILGLAPGAGGAVDAIAGGRGPGGSTSPVGGARDLAPSASTSAPGVLRRTSPFGSAVSSVPGAFGGSAPAVAGTLADLPDEVEAAVATVFETDDAELDPDAVNSLADTLDATGKLGGLSDAARASLTRFATMLRQKAVRVRAARDKAAADAAAAAGVGARGLELLPFLAELPETIQSAVVPIFEQVSGGGDLRNLTPADALLLKPGAGLVPVPGQILPSAEDLTSTAVPTRLLTKGTTAEAAGEATAYLLEVLASDPSVPKRLFVTAGG